MGWITSTRNFPTNLSLVGDLARYPELRFLDRFDILVFLSWLGIVRNLRPVPERVLRENLLLPAAGNG